MASRTSDDSYSVCRPSVLHPTASDGRGVYLRHKLQSARSFADCCQRSPIHATPDSGATQSTMKASVSVAARSFRKKQPVHTLRVRWVLAELDLCQVDRLWRSNNILADVNWRSHRLFFFFFFFAFVIISTNAVMSSMKCVYTLRRCDVFVYSA